MWRQRLYGSGWALQACLRHSPLPFGSSPTLSGRLQAAKVGCHICGVRAGNGTHRLVSGNHVTGDLGANGLFKLFTLDGFMEGVWCLDLVRVVVFLCSWLASSSSRFVVWYVACIGWLAVCCSLVDRLFCLAAGSSSRTSSSLLCADYLTSRRCRALSVPQRFAVEALGLVTVRQVLSISAC